MKNKIRIYLLVNSQIQMPESLVRIKEDLENGYEILRVDKISDNLIYFLQKDEK